MSLHGSLQTFALPDVLTLLASTRKTGELQVTGPRLDGRVWVVAGQLVGAAAGRTTDPVDAIFELLRLIDGEFAFEQDQAAPRPSTPRPLEPVVAEAQERLAEWQEIAAVVPSLDAEVRLIADPPTDIVTLPASQWRLVVVAASERTVGAVADRLGLGEFAACRAVKGLIETGLASISATGHSPAAEEMLAPVPAPVVEEVEEDPLPVGLVQMVTAAEEPVPAPAPGFVADGDDPVDGELNRGLLLKFLSSVRS